MNLREQQAGIRERYRAEPEGAKIVLRVRSAASDLSDPLHCRVVPEAAADVSWRSGAHAAVGGAGDVPCSGDLLIGALAACQETTIRMVAANMGIQLEALDLVVEADWDPRGTLAMGDYPVGLIGIRCRTSVTIAGDVNGERAARLLRTAEKYCVVLSTLSKGVPVESTFDLNQATHAGEPGRGTT